MSFLTELFEYTAKSAVVIKDLVLKGDYETATLLMSLQSTANDDTLPTDVRLNALTALINRGGLLDIALPPYYPVEYTFPKTQTYVGLHNDLSGLNTGDYYHLTYDEYVGFLNKPSIADINFSNLQTGSPYDSVPLGIALNNKQNLIPSGSSGQFYAWDNTMRFVSWANLSNKPTTLSGLGISAADTLFDGKYVLQSSIMTSYTLGSNASITNTDSLVDALGKLQAQIDSISSVGGTINTVGLSMPGMFSVGNSPLTGAGGTINVTLSSQSAKTFFAAPNAGSGTPTFRQILAADLPTSGVTAGTYGNTTSWPTFTVDAYGRITSVNTQLATSGGTVTSVALSAPVEFSISGSPVISNGTLGFSWTNQTANYVMAGPVSGVAASPSFRALVAADIPTIEMSQVNGLDGYLDSYLPNALANSTMFIGNGSDAAVNATATGDVTLLYVDNLGANEAQFTIANQAVTYAKMQNVSGQKLLGRYAIAAGPPQEITFDPTAFTLNSSSGVLGLVNPNPPTLNQKGDLLTSNGTAQVRLGIGSDATFFMADNAATTGNKWVAMGGDATLATSGDLTISAGAVTLSKMADADAYSIIGNDTSSPNTPIYLTKAQATTLINSFDPSANLPGLVPNGSSNDATKFLAGDGTWMQPSGSGTVISSTGGQVAVYSGGAGSTSVAGLAFAGAGLYLKTNATNDGVEWATAGVTIPTANRALVSDAGGLITASTTTTTQLQYLSSATGTTGTATTNLVFSASPTMDSPYIGTTATTGHIHFRKAAASIPSGFANTATLWFPENGGNKRMAIMWDNLGYASEFQLDATGAQTYTFPNASGTVTLLGNSTTGSGNIVLATSPTLTTPSIGAATGASLDVTGALTSGVAGPAGTAGQIVLRNATSSATQTIRGTDPTTSIIYDLPTTAPSAGQVLQASAPVSNVVTLSWQNAGSGNVVGPGSSTSGNFAVFANSVGTLLADSTIVRLSGGAMTIGTSGTQGSLIFNDGTTANTVTLRAANNTGATSYIFPTSNGSNTNVLTLSNATTGQLSWSAAGTGDITRAGTNQVVTGNITFSQSALIFRNTDATRTATMSLLATTGGAANYTVTLQQASGTVALLEGSQNWTGAQTFGTGAFAVTSAATFSGSSTTTLSVVGSTTVPQLTINGGGATTMNWISIAQGGAANPVTGATPTTGTKLRFRAATSTSTLDSAIGLDANSNLWFSTGTSAIQADNRFSFYMPVLTTATEVVRITQNGIALGEILSTPAAGRTGALLVLSNQVTTASPSYIRFDGFPSGTVTPNSSGVTPTGRLGSGSRLVFYIPGGASAYPTAMGYHNQGGIFAAMAVATQFSIFGDAVESFRMTASNNTSTGASISLVNSAGTLNQVVGPRITGWGAPTATQLRAALTNASTTTDVLQTLAALIVDLRTHGLINN